MSEQAENAVRHGGCGEPRVNAPIRGAMEGSGIRKVMGPTGAGTGSGQMSPSDRISWPRPPVSVMTNRAKTCPSIASATPLRTRVRYSTRFGFGRAPCVPGMKREFDITGPMPFGEEEWLW